MLLSRPEMPRPVVAPVFQVLFDAAPAAVLAHRTRATVLIQPIPEEVRAQAARAVGR